VLTELEKEFKSTQELKEYISYRRSFNNQKEKKWTTMTTKVT
jgi:hypothetical protein